MKAAVLLLASVMMLPVVAKKTTVDDFKGKYRLVEGDEHCHKYRERFVVYEIAKDSYYYDEETKGLVFEYTHDDGDTMRDFYPAIGMYNDYESYTVNHSYPFNLPFVTSRIYSQDKIKFRKGVIKRTVQEGTIKFPFRKVYSSKGIRKLFFDDSGQLVDNHVIKTREESGIKEKVRTCIFEKIE